MLDRFFYFKKLEYFQNMGSWETKKEYILFHKKIADNYHAFLFSFLSAGNLKVVSVT